MMRLLSKIIFFNFIFLINFFIFNVSFSDNHNIYEVLENLQKDISTLEKAVYSGTVKISNSSDNSSTSNLNNNSEDVLTRH